ncbi:hypothetical protein SOP93_17045 [Peribacillus frigoritolerans]|uniref:hypothetical protein n=1 Tax=Peribacillus frigoritolerans TaxID=450367 RepID=UPI002B23FAA1|nr:hypothetical protein [Peribacillus frigoritolerans]MEB2492873.1 hypothetical protein [Peribacillus frigoritolerans]
MQLWYHGTTNDNANKIKEMGFIIDPNNYIFNTFGSGVYFTDDKQTAQTFGETIITTTINIKNPLTLTYLEFINLGIPYRKENHHVNITNWMKERGHYCLLIKKEEEQEQDILVVYDIKLINIIDIEYIEWEF